MTRLWFHNGKGGSLQRQMVSKIIKVWQGPFVHVEAQIGFDELGNFSNHSISSRGFEGKGFKNGVQVKKIDYKKHPKRWVSIDIEKEINEYGHLIGKEYDYFGAIGWKYGKQNGKKWFCSELICHLLGLQTMYPTKLYKHLKENGC